MSKSLGNVINPDDMINLYGADALRCYEMFIGDYEKEATWSEQGLKGCKRFIDRVIKKGESLNDSEEYTKDLEILINKTIKKVTEDFENLGFNTAISQMMIFVNAVYKEGKCPRDYAEGLIKMLSCICPHIGEEIWSVLGHDNTIAYEPWPTYDESKTADDTVEVVVQVNGKVRAKLNIPVDMDKAEALAAAKAEVADMVEGKTVIKEIVVPNKLINIVVK